MATFGIYLMGAALLVVAGTLKALRPYDTARAVAAALPATPARMWPPAVRALAVVEAALGVVAIALPGRPVALAVAVSYLGFALWVLWARAQGGSLSSCGCFGTPEVPPTVLHAVLNAVAAGGAVGVAVAAPSGSVLTDLSRQYFDGVPLVAASALAAWLVYLVMSPLARLGALRATSPSSPGARP
jgi:hypothetical protein